jgi:hypothetical protein
MKSRMKHAPQGEARRSVSGAAPLVPAAWGFNCTNFRAARNASTVTTNDLTVTSNSGTVTTNSATGTATTNTGTVATNAGVVAGGTGTIGANTGNVTGGRQTVTGAWSNGALSAGARLVFTGTGAITQGVLAGIIDWKSTGTISDTDGPLSLTGSTIYAHKNLTVAQTGPGVTPGTCRIVSVGMRGRRYGTKVSSPDVAIPVVTIPHWADAA